MAAVLEAKLAGDTSEAGQAGGADVIVLGAGVAGLAAAKFLRRAGYRVTVVERAARCGGTHRSREIGPYTFDVGSIFYEENARLFELAPELKEMCPPTRRVQRRIGPAGAVLHYPIEPRDLLRWPAPTLVRAFVQMLVSRLAVRRDGTLDAICRARLGRTIFEKTGLRSYITRFHHVSPTELDEEFFHHRMGFIARATEIGMLWGAFWRMIRRKPPRKGPPARLRVRPAEGFAPLFDRIRRQLVDEGVVFRMSETVERIARTDRGFEVTTNSGTLRGEAVVGSIPVDMLCQAVFGRPSGLQSLDLLTLFVSAGRLDASVGNVLFNFHGDGRWKRMTVYSRIYPELMRDREFFAVEITLPPGHAPDPDEAFRDLRAHLEAVGVAADLVLEGHEVVSDCYPLYRKGAVPQVAEALAELKQAGIVAVGRQGRFEYLPTSSGVIRRVVDELKASGLSETPTLTTFPVAPAA